jgi:hypothetical protein
MTRQAAPLRLSIPDRIEIAISSWRMIDGLWIGVSVDESKVERALQRLEEALLLIKASDPRRYRRALHDLSRVWIRLLPNTPASFNAAARACQLDTRFVLDDTVSAAELAAAIVHEATHARIEHCGIRYQEEIRHRIECACVRQELSFARRVPGATELEERFNVWLAGPRDKGLWSDSSLARQRVEGLVDGLVYLGVPGCVIAVFLWIRRRVVWLRRAA